jgi:hypothetical protein
MVSLIIIVCQKNTKKERTKSEPWFLVSWACGLICCKCEM